MARPKSNIDWDFIDEHLQAHCDGVGIAGLLGIHPNTLYRLCEEKHNISFSEYSAQKKAEGKELLRKIQFKTALSGDKTMMVWLGKQYLDQKDRNEQVNKTDTSLTIVAPTEEEAEIIKRISNDNNATDKE